MMLPDIVQSELVAIAQVVSIDLVLAGDNAIVVGMAACGVAPGQRGKVIFFGILAAVVLRIAFAAATTELLSVIGLTLAGGIVLLWVCWKLYRELRDEPTEAGAVRLLAGELGDADCSAGVAVMPEGHAAVAAIPHKRVRDAIWQVVVADVSMSLDNVLAVAGAAGKHMSALVLGLSLSVLLMGICATVIAGLLQRHRWIGYLGLLLIVYVAGRMIVEGGMEVGEAMAGL